VNVAAPADDRRLLVEAAIEIASVRGFADTTAAMITERAGLEPATFGRIYDAPEGCFFDAWDALRDCYLSAVEREAEDTDWLEQLRHLAHVSTVFVAREPGRARLLASEILELGRPGRERLDALLDRLTVIVDRGRELAEDPSKVPPITAQGIVGGAHHRLVRVLRATERVAPENLANELTSFAVAPYLGVEAASKELARPT